MTAPPREGCECPTHHADTGRRVAKDERCTAKWVRCNGALRAQHAQRVKDAKNLLKVTP